MLIEIKLLKFWVRTLFLDNHEFIPLLHFDSFLSVFLNIKYSESDIAVDDDVVVPLLSIWENKKKNQLHSATLSHTECSLKRN